MVRNVYEEMRDKYGWNDGSLEPANACEVRDMLVKYINDHLPPDSSVEAYGFDRPGYHNGAMIRYRRKDDPGTNADEPEEVDEILSRAEEDGVLIIYPQLIVEHRKEKQ